MACGMDDIDGDSLVELFDGSEPVDRKMLSNALLMALARRRLVVDEASECFNFQGTKIVINRVVSCDSNWQ